MGLSTAVLSKAVDSLLEAMDLHIRASEGSPEQRAFRDASIQRFEYCIELSWRVAMKLLGSTTAAAKPAVREMARSNLISTPSAWIEFIEARNNTSHSYDESVAKKVFAAIQNFLPEVKSLQIALQNLSK